MPAFKEILIPVFAAAIGGAATLLVGVTGHFSKNRELDIRMLELSLQILREDPSQSQTKAARGWAVDLINHVSPVRIPAEVREQLIANKLTIEAVEYGWFGRDEEGKLRFRRKVPLETK